MFQNIISETED